MIPVTVYIGALIVVLIAAYFKFLFRIRKDTEPPIPKGHFIWGNGEQFHKNAVQFLHNTQKKLGDIFTIRLFHQHLTILMDPHAYDSMVKEKNFDFDAIQRQVNHNVFSFALTDARKMIKEAGKTVKGPYLNKGMHQYAKYLNDAYVDVNARTEMDPVKSDWHTDGLRSFNAKTLFSALFFTIFGKTEQGTTFEPNSVFKHFDAFHKYFNYLWLGMPVNMFPEALKSLKFLCAQPCSQDLLKREDLSEYIRFSMNFMLENGQTEQDIIGHNLVYLHVNYNTFRMAFWAIYKLMEHPEALEALRAEVQEIVEKREDSENENGEIELSLEDVDRLPILDSITKETLRVSGGVFMVRSVAEDTEFETEEGRKYSLRKGDKVAMYPPAIHKDPEIFENPDEYKYDRFVDATFYKNGKVLKNPILAFGSLCPGKKYALCQAKWFMLSLVNAFDFELCEGEKTECDINYHGHEILPPTNDVQIRYRIREGHKKLIFV